MYCEQIYNSVLKNTVEVSFARAFTCKAMQNQFWCMSMDYCYVGVDFVWSISDNIT